MLVIGLCGSIGSGKTAIAMEILFKACTGGNSAAICSMADPLKKLAVEHFGWDRKKDARGRILLQILGTEAGREYNKDLWVDKLDSRVKKYSKETIVIVDDVRFDNEVEYIENSGGKVFYIDRGDKIACTHKSENGIDYSKHKITVVDNNGVIDEAVEVILNST